MFFNLRASPHPLWVGLLLITLFGPGCVGRHPVLLEVIDAHSGAPAGPGIRVRSQHVAVVAPWRRAVTDAQGQARLDLGHYDSLILRLDSLLYAVPPNTVFDGGLLTDAHRLNRWPPTQWHVRITPEKQQARD